jgi:superfamily II DNA or RNA helicase
MQVILAGWAWLPMAEMGESTVDCLKRSLTKTPRVPQEYEPEDGVEPVQAFVEQSGLLGIPRQFFMEGAQLEHKIHDERSAGDVIEQERCVFMGNITGHPRWEEQTHAMRVVIEAYSTGKVGGIVQAAPAFGKTALAIRTICAIGRKTLVVVHKEFLADQWKARIEKMAPYLRVGIWQGEKEEVEGKDVVVGLVQTLANREVSPEVAQQFGLCIHDECFIAGTMLRTDDGDRSIEQVRKGDTIHNALGEGMVENVLVRTTEIDRLVRVRFADGSDCICTQEHPFLTTVGWTVARDLCGMEVLTWDGCIDILQRHGTEVTHSLDVSMVRERILSAEREKVLLSEMLREVEVEDRSDAILFGLWQANERAPLPSLFGGMPEDMASEMAIHGRSSTTTFGAGYGMARCQSTHCSGSIDTNESTESDVQARSERETESHPEGDGSSSSIARRQWDFHSCPAEDAILSLGRRMDSGVSSENEETSRGRVSKVLQGGHRAFDCNDSGRSGREKPRRAGQAGAGSKEGCYPSRIGVVCVSRVKREDLERRGIRCEGDTVTVFNLSVRGHPSYVLASGVVVHNCHRIGARTWHTVPPKFAPRFHLGLSARPKRIDGMDDLIRWLVGPVIYKAAYVTPVPRIHRITTPYKRPAWIVRAEAGGASLTYSTHLKAMVSSQTRNHRIVDELERILRAKNGRKVVVMSERVAHLDDMAAILRDRDLKEPIPDLTMGFYHSKVGKEARQEAERKRIVFSTFQMLEEGFDISALDTLVMTTARASVEQPVGRIRRECVLGVNVTENECKYYCPWRAGSCKSKPKPIVVEFTDEDVAVVVRKIGNRSRYYREMGAEVLEARQ